MRAAVVNEIPPPLELLCLNALWALEEGNVEAVRKAVSARKPLAYTTVLTLLDRLTRRGTVSRRKQARAFYYQPQVSRDALRRLALKEFVGRYFDGSEEQLLAFVSRAAPEPATVEQKPERLDTVLL